MPGSKADVLGRTTFQLFDVLVRFRSNSRRLVEILEYLYGPNRASIESSIGAEVVVMKTVAGRYELYFPGLPLQTYVHEWELLLHFKARLIEFFWRRRKPLLFHAGVVAWKGRGLMLVGGDGAGKTTLTLGLVARGYSYLSDEYGVFDLDSGLLRYYPAPISVRTGSLVFQNDLLGLRAKRRDDLYEINVWDKSEANEIKPLFPAPVFQDPVDKAIPRWIVVLTPNFSGRVHLEREHSQGGAWKSLVFNAGWHRHWTDLNPPETGLKIKELIGKTEVFRLSVGSFVKTLDVLEGVLGK